MLDLSQPHDQVFGLPGVAWSQNGCLYDVNGNHVTYRRENTGEVDGIGDPVFRTIVERIAEPAKEPAKPSEGGDPDEGSLEGMHWKHLQVMMAQYGQTYTNKDEAIAFLRGKHGG